MINDDTIPRDHSAAIISNKVRRPRVGRTPLSKDTVELVLRIARESPTWSYDRIRGALVNPGHYISGTTVANILKAHDGVMATVNGSICSHSRHDRQTWIILP